MPTKPLNILSSKKRIKSPQLTQPSLLKEVRDEDGTLRTYHTFKKHLHNPNGPAVKYQNGSYEYWLDGQLHRIGKPAKLIKANTFGQEETCEYWEEGKKHREGAPAVEKIDICEYWVEGRLHRTGGPAVVHKNGSYQYYLKGVMHREKGPAYLLKDDKGNLLKKEYRFKGYLHRENGPAIVALTGGEKEVAYYQKGRLHRENAPAYILEKEDGTLLKEHWAENDRLHRENDLPALTENEGTRYTQKWYLRGRLHRERDLPAYIVFKNNQLQRLSWHQKNVLHRIDKPAKIERLPIQKIRKEWFEHGRISSWREFELPDEEDHFEGFDK